MGFVLCKPFRQKQAKVFAQLLPRPGRASHTPHRDPAPRDSPRASGRGEAGRGRYLRPGWLLPARIRRTRSGRPSRQLSAVDTRKICPPCTEKQRSSGATELPTLPAATGPPVTAAPGQVSARPARRRCSPPP